MSPSFENTTCQVVWDMGQEHTTMALPFRLKLNKGCTKIVCVHLCSNGEVAKPSSKMTLWYSKIAVMWQVQVKSPTHYFGSFLIQTNSRRTYITYYCTLLLLRGVLDLEGLYHSYTRTMKHFRDQIQDGRQRLLRYWKKPASGIVLQKFILVNLRCLYKDNLKRAVFMIL